MQTVVHTNRRGCYFKYVKDDGPNFGYSSRVAYAMGLDKPHYPVPALYTTVMWGPSWNHNISIWIKRCENAQGKRQGWKRVWINK